MKIYVASAFSDYERTRSVQDIAKFRGHEITCDWTQEVGKFESDAAVPLDFARQAARNGFLGVVEADVVIVLSPDANKKEIGCGMWVELGIALGNGIPVVISGGQRTRTIFTRLEGVTLVAYDTNAVDAAEAVYDRDTKRIDAALESAAKKVGTSDAVNHPAHYNTHPSGVECIDIVEHFGFCIGNAIKYAWRAGLKTESPLEDLRKGRWYLDREISRLEKE